MKKRKETRKPTPKGEWGWEHEPTGQYARHTIKFTDGNGNVVPLFEPQKKDQKKVDEGSK